MGLGTLNSGGKEPRVGKSTLLFLAAVLTTLALFSIVVIGVGAYVTLVNKSKSSEEAVEIVLTTIPTTTTSTTSTTSTIPTTTTSVTTTISTPTTTTTLCGGSFQEPCAGNKCNQGFIIGSTGMCHPKECAPSVQSGKGGCGAFALNFCRG